MKKVNYFSMALIALFVVIGCNKKITAPVSTGAFYELGVNFIRSDANGKDYFQVFAKGANNEDCKRNAKMQLMKILIYDGSTKGSKFPPILNTPEQISKFQLIEQSFYKNYLANDDVLEVNKINKENTMAQSDKKDTQLTMQIVIGIDRVKFKTDVLNSIKQ